jgi:hypothetical protein
MSGAQLDLNALGADRQEQLRYVRAALDERGWQDYGDMSQGLIERLAAQGGRAGWQQLARAIPGEFLSRNEIKRRDVEELVQDLLCRSRSR